MKPAYAFLFLVGFSQFTYAHNDQTGLLDSDKQHLAELHQRLENAKSRQTLIHSDFLKAETCEKRVNENKIACKDIKPPVYYQKPLAEANANVKARENDIQRFLNPND